MPQKFGQLSRYGGISKWLPKDLAPTGKVFFVGSTADAFYADYLLHVFPPDEEGEVRVFSTIDTAIAACTANRGDVILVIPNHAEDVADATTFQVDIAGISIIGLGHRANQPTFTLTAAAGSIELDSANCRISNLRILAGAAPVTVGVNVNADGNTIDHCDFDVSAAANRFTDVIDVDAFDYTVIKKCRFITDVNVFEANSAIRMDDANQTEINDNWFSGNWAEGPIVGEGALSNNIRIVNNFLYSSNTADNIGIDLNVASTGLIAYNTIGGVADATIGNMLDPGSCLSIENYIANAIDESGILIPASVST